MARNKYLYIITININGLNAPFKRYRKLNEEEIMTHTDAAFRTPTLGQKTYTD